MRLHWTSISLGRGFLSGLDVESVSTSDAEEMAAQQHAAFALDMRREREKLKAEHQAEIAAVWSRIAAATEAGVEPRDVARDVHE